MVARVWATVIGVVGLTVGCGSTGTDPARDAATRFVTAVGSGDAAAACGLLSSEVAADLEKVGGCTRVLPDLGLPDGPVREVAVWGDGAQVRTADDTLFMRELEDGWRVVAAGCLPRGELPYDCAVGS